jgi:hypothetical protein
MSFPTPTTEAKAYLRAVCDVVVLLSCSYLVMMATALTLDVEKLATVLNVSTDHTQATVNVIYIHKHYTKYTFPLFNKKLGDFGKSLTYFTDRVIP